MAFSSDSIEGIIHSGKENPIEIKVINNGPYVVTGDVKIVDTDGNEFKTEGTVVMCRCGHSENKPFCDATHRKVPFDSTVTAK